MDTMLDEIRARVEERLRELEPLVDEYRQLERVRAHLEPEPEKAPSGAADTPTTRRRGQRARRQGSRRSTRADESAALVAARPGITTHEIAREMGIDPNYLYRVLPRLEKEGRLVRRDGGWHPPG